MTQYQITVNHEFLQRLFLSNNKYASTAPLLKSILNQILQAQASEQLKTDPYEYSSERKGEVSGTYPHKLITRIGTITLLPRFRNG